MTVLYRMESKFADPISSIALSGKYVVSGSMLGRIGILDVTEKQYQILQEISNENVVAIEFHTDEDFSIAIGDEEIARYKITYFENLLNSEQIRIKNYDDELVHKSKCDNCFVMLSKNQLIMINIPSTEAGNTIVKLEMSITIKNFLEKDSIIKEFTLPMTNYTIPLDFDTNLLVWIEYTSDSSRNFCVHNLNNLSTTKHILNKEFGHVSFCRILSSNKVILVRMHNLVEIRSINDFKLLRSFVNIGEEIIALDFYSNSPKVVINEQEINQCKSHDVIQMNNNNIISSKDIVGNEQNLLKIIDDKSSKLGLNPLNIGTEDVKDENITVTLLDLDGNVNVWENFNISTKYNLYCLNGISDEIKSKHFFSLGYPYYIKTDCNLHVISTDYGIFVIKKE